MLKTTVSGIIMAALTSTLSIGTNLVLPTASSPEPVQTQVQVQEQIQEPVQEQIQKPMQEQPVTPEGNTNNRNYNGAGCIYTDENGDGICDYCFSSSDCALHENCPSGYSGQTQRHHNSGCGNGSRRGCHR